MRAQAAFSSASAARRIMRTCACARACGLRTESCQRPECGTRCPPRRRTPTAGPAAGRPSQAAPPTAPPERPVEAEAAARRPQPPPRAASPAAAAGEWHSRQPVSPVSQSCAGRPEPCRRPPPSLGGDGRASAGECERQAVAGGPSAQGVALRSAWQLQLEQGAVRCAAASSWPRPCANYGGEHQGCRVHFEAVVLRCASRLEGAGELEGTGD
jgi:hypothetical protein